MKAYLIDPQAREVTAVDVRAMATDSTTPDIQHMYELMRCSCLEAINPLNSRGDLIYLDENGKLRPNDYFLCRLWPYEPLAGRAIWIGSDGRGGNRSPAMDIDYVSAHIAWGYL